MTSGFVANFTLDGRVAEKNHLKYSSGQTRKIKAMIAHLLDTIQKLKRKQANRISRNHSRRSRVNKPYRILSLLQ